MNRLSLLFLNICGFSSVVNVVELQPGQVLNSGHFRKHPHVRSESHLQLGKFFAELRSSPWRLEATRDGAPMPLGRERSDELVQYKNGKFGELHAFSPMTANDLACGGE